MHATPASATVLRTLGLVAAASIAVSNMIGQGVFLKARVMTCNVGSPALMLGAWVLAGALALCGALTLAELGAALPESGGIYAFLRRAYGAAVAFAYGWMLLFVGSPASIAALAAGAAIFCNLFTAHALDALGVRMMFWGVPLNISGMQCAALAFIALLTAVNCAPAAVNGGIATVFAAFKIAMLAAIAGAAYTSGHGDLANYRVNGASGTCSDVAASVRGGVAGFAAALVGALYGYQGWQSLTLVAGEVRRPGRTIPIALIASVALVSVLYTGANAAYVFTLGPIAIASLAPTASVGVTIVELLFGPVGRIVAAMLLFASALATLHVTILVSARVTFAMARDTLGFEALARVSRRGHVPVNAVVANGALAMALVLAGSFDTLSNYLVFNAWVFFVATGIAMFVLRAREPALERPYRTFGYPVVPAMYVAIGTWLLVQTALSSPRASAIGLAIVAVSFPVYMWRRRPARL